MGYKYGTKRYGQGLYSRDPDTWQTQACEATVWTAVDCDPVTTTAATAQAAARSALPVAFGAVPLNSSGDPLTTQLDLFLPIVGDADGEDLWGDKLNSNFTILDTFAGETNARLDTIEEQTPVEDAPADGQTYARRTNEWVPIVDSAVPVWDDIVNKPSSFPPSPHAHDATDITSGVLDDFRVPLRLWPAAWFIPDWNLATANGWYMAAGSLNAPTPDIWYIGEAVVHGTDWYTQEVWAFANNSNSDTMTYWRQCKNGTWTPWVRVRKTEEELDARYGLKSAVDGKVAKAGDTMTGPLGISARDALVYLTKTEEPSNVAGVLAFRGDKARWQFLLADWGTEAGGNTGSNCTFYAYDDAGVNAIPAIQLERATGLLRAFGGVELPPAMPVTAGAAAHKAYVDAQVAAAPGANGQCRLWMTSTTQLALFPHNGDKLIINGKSETIPANGIAISNAGLVGNNVYLVFAKMVGAVMGLEFDGPAAGRPTWGVTRGVPHKTGDPTRTLVGMICTAPDTTFINNELYRYVASYYNRCVQPFAGSIAEVHQAATVPGHLGAQCHCLSWGEDALTLTLSGYGTNIVNNGTIAAMPHYFDYYATIPAWSGFSHAALANPSAAGLLCSMSMTYHVPLSVGLVAVAAFGWVGSGTGVFTLVSRNTVLL